MFPFPGLMLYHRIPRAKALDNANRQRVYDAIREEPAIRVGTLAARLGLNRDTVLEHIRVLERFRLVESAGAGQRRYFASGMIGSIVEKNAIAATSASSTKRVLSLVQARGEVEFRDLVRSLGLSSPLTSWSVKRLERAGLVRKERRGDTRKEPPEERRPEHDAGDDLRDHHRLPHPPREEPDRAREPDDQHGLRDEQRHAGPAMAGRVAINERFPRLGLGRIGPEKTLLERMLGELDANIAGKRIDAVLADPVGNWDRLVEEHRLKRVVEHPGPRYERHRGEYLARHLVVVAIEERGKLARRRSGGYAGEVELGRIGAPELSCP